MITKVDAWSSLVADRSEQDLSNSVAKLTTFVKEDSDRVFTDLQTGEISSLRLTFSLPER